MDNQEFMDAISEIHNFSIKFKKFEDNPQKLLEEIKNLEVEQLKKQRDRYDPKEDPGPVNIIRFLILDKILENDEMKLDILNKIRENLEKANLDYFENYPKIKI